MTASAPVPPTAPAEGAADVIAITAVGPTALERVVAPTGLTPALMMHILDSPQRDEGAGTSVVQFPLPSLSTEERAIVTVKRTMSGANSLEARLKQYLMDTIKLATDAVAVH